MKRYLIRSFSTWRSSMRARSAGILLYRIRNGLLQVFVCHPGGPYGFGSDEGKWSIPKGGIEPNETELEAAKRELQEETGIVRKEYTDIAYLGIAKQSRKDVEVFSARYISNEDPIVVSITTEIEWPRNSGTFIEIPEIDRGEFVSTEVAKYRLTSGQKEIIDKLVKYLEVKKD